MLDLHCHILPATDDGPKTLEVSLEMARLASADGITDIIATPHQHKFLRLLRADIMPRVAALNEALKRSEIEVKIWPGSEIRLDDIAAYRADYEGEVLCHLGDHPDFSLLEWPWDTHMDLAGEAQHVLWLRERGTQPIVAHPERHPFFCDDLGRLDALVEAGAWLQITAGSLFGFHGAQPAAMAPQMLARYREVVIATDSHNLRRRSGLSPAYEWIEDRFGKRRSDEIRGRAESVLERLRATPKSSTLPRAAVK